MDFGSHLRELRKARRLTQQQLAEAVGVDFTYISKLENDRVDPPSEATIRRLAEVLEADPDPLLDRAGKPVPDLKAAVAQDPQLALLLRTISGRRLRPDQYRRILAIAEEAAVPHEDFVPDRELERRADQLLSQYERQEGTIRHPPVPIDLIIEHVLGIDIDWSPLDLRGDQGTVLAAIELTGSRRRIVMNERERTHFERYFGTEAYSKAHEVGHAILHLPQPPGLQPPLGGATGPVVFCRSSRRDVQEIQAERFAAYLLMPERLVRAAVGNQSVTGWRRMYELRDAFKVSITAMRRRLEALNLTYVDRDGNVHPSREAGTGQLGLPS
jgi:transcriptional regulator with XRE-family HTH domain